MSGLVARLIAAGTPADLIEEVAMLCARAAIDREAIEGRRTKDRERQNARRNVTSRDTADVADGHDENPSLDKSPQTPKINPNPGTHTHEAPARRASTWPCPEGVDPTHWRDFLTNRKHKRLVSTETARLGVMRSIAEIADDEWPPGRLVEHAAAKGWASINDPRENAGPRNARQQQKPANDGLGSTVRSGLDALRILEQRAGH